MLGKKVWWNARWRCGGGVVEVWREHEWMDGRKQNPVVTLRD
jgi:hypothetical protein